MKKINNLIWKLRIMKDTRGQDLIEYALMAGFVAVAAGRDHAYCGHRHLHHLQQGEQRRISGVEHWRLLNLQLQFQPGRGVLSLPGVILTDSWPVFQNSRQETGDTLDSSRGSTHPPLA